MQVPLLRKDFVMTRMIELEHSGMDPIRNAFQELESRASAWFRAQNIAREKWSLLRSLDMRYEGQNYEIEVIFSPDEVHRTVAPTAVTQKLTIWTGSSSAEVP